LAKRRLKEGASSEKAYSRASVLVKMLVGGEAVLTEKVRYGFLSYVPVASEQFASGLARRSCIEAWEKVDEHPKILFWDISRNIVLIHGSFDSVVVSTGRY
jgi:hypothetical protein